MFNVQIVRCADMQMSKCADDREKQKHMHICISAHLHIRYVSKFS